jgi:hypothetical protein
VVGEIGFGTAELSDGEAGIDNGGCGGRAHTPQGTPGRRVVQGGGSGLWKSADRGRRLPQQVKLDSSGRLYGTAELLGESGVSGGGTAFSRNGTRQVTLG